MYDVLDVSRYIINSSNKQGYTVSNLKLQKLLYFVQGFFLAIDHKPCFPNRIEAWNLGPVIPDAYHEFKRFGSNSIPDIEQYFKVNEEDVWKSETMPYDINVISQEDRSKIDTVLNLYKDYPATQLVRLTHMQAPWKNAYKSKKRNAEISQESIEDYFIKRYLRSE